MQQLMRCTTPRYFARGFSLVELMVGLVVGLVVVGAVLALVVAIMQSNRETLQSTRLNQELRAALALVATDLRRARSVDDPMTEAMAVGGNRYKSVKTVNGPSDYCVIYGYALDLNHDGVLDNDSWHVIKLDESGPVHGLVLLTATSKPANCPPTPSNPPRLSSDQVEISALEIRPTQQGAVIVPGTTTSTEPMPPNDPTDERIVRELTVTITGHLVDPNTGLAGISRTVSQTVFVRSVGAGI